MIIRASSVYGAGLRRGLIATFATKLLRGEAVTVQHHGRYTVDLVDVADVAAAVVAMLDHADDGALNIGAGVATTSLELARLLAELTGAPHELVTVAGGHEAPPGFPALSIERARRLLGFQPRALRTGLAAYVDWIRRELA